MVAAAFFQIPPPLVADRKIKFLCQSNNQHTTHALGRCNNRCRHYLRRRNTRCNKRNGKIKFGERLIYVTIWSSAVTVGVMLSGSLPALSLELTLLTARIAASLTMNLRSVPHKLFVTTATADKSTDDPIPKLKRFVEWNTWVECKEK